MNEEKEQQVHEHSTTTQESVVDDECGLQLQQHQDEEKEKDDI